MGKLIAEIAQPVHLPVESLPPRRKQALAQVALVSELGQLDSRRIQAAQAQSGFLLEELGAAAGAEDGQPLVAGPVRRDQIRHHRFEMRQQPKYDDADRQLEQVALRDQAIDTVATQNQPAGQRLHSRDQLRDRHVR